MLIVIFFIFVVITKAVRTMLYISSLLNVCFIAGSETNLHCFVLRSYTARQG